MKNKVMKRILPALLTVALIAMFVCGKVGAALAQEGGGIHVPGVDSLAALSGCTHVHDAACGYTEGCRL